MKSIRFEDFEILIKEILMLDKDISLKKLNLLEIGLNSLQTMRIVNRLKQMGAVISFAELMEKPYIEKWWEILSERMKLEDLLSDQKDTKAISKESNSLTDVQYAYWIGRGKKQILGGVSCHAYFEFKGSVLDIGKLKEAWHKIQYRHPMLRARFLENGTQQIIERNKFSNELLVYDLRGKQSEIEEHLLKVRTTNSHRVFDIEKGHVAALEVTIINNKEYVIHFDIDLLVADLKSIRIVLNDLAALYGEKYLPELPDNVNFMNYIVNTKQSDYIKDREYWNQKMDDMPGMPELPICKKIIQIKKPVFKRRNFFLDENRWRRLLEICAFRQVTPAMVLLSLYAEVLGKFSNSSRFIINVPFFGRPLDVENINFVVGDFTNILLLPIDISGKNQFIDQVYNITEIFMEVMKHNSYSGVEVIRDLLKKDAGNKLIAPVVFSCNYDETMVPALFEKKLGKLDYISTQTPQVLIDFQILKMTESVFASHKGEIVFEFPSNESKLDLSGQTIYVTRFVNELEPIRKHDVRMYLEEQVSPYMVPANILVIPEIPLTSNRKVDTKAVKNYFMGIEETNKKGGTELPQTDLEKRIADIWCKELNISNIGRNDSFYLVGGDSLLIAQVIGKMLEKIPEAEGWEWSALLTEMMQTPTIKGIAEKIEAFQKDTDYVIDPCLVQLKKSVKENSQSVAKVLFHAGTGTLTPYNTLLSYIEKDSKENEAIIGFTFGDDADYISMETSQTFRLLGEKYGKILNKLGYSNYILIGHCVGGLIALETAQYLQKKNVQVSDVTLISSNIPKQKNQTILSQATDEIYRKTLQSSLDNEILLERIFAKLIGADAYKAGYQVDEERLQQYIEYIVDQGTGDITVEALCNTGGKFEDVAEEFRLLASKSVSERLNALYNIIERPNGELMEHQLKMLNILFRVFSQNFRCVSTYEPKPYYGNMRILCCEIQGGHFYPGFFAEDYETWKPYAKGNLTFELIKGWHLDCITEPNLGENIKKMLDFNY